MAPCPANREEREQGSDPENTDSDSDGLTDGEEKRTGGDPTRPDSDDDGLPDADEAAAGLNLREQDTDKRRADRRGGARRRAPTRPRRTATARWARPATA